MVRSNNGRLDENTNIRTYNNKEGTGQSDVVVAYASKCLNMVAGGCLKLWVDYSPWTALEVFPRDQRLK